MSPIQPLTEPLQTQDPRVHQLRRSPGLLALHGTARNRHTSQADFVSATRRIMRLLLEETLSHLRYDSESVTTPTGFPFHGRALVQQDLYAVSVPRAGDALEAELREICPGTRFGKVLIQRDPITKFPKLYYQKLPATIAGKQVILLDPMMATAGTACLAVETLQSAGVREEDIVLANVLTCHSGLTSLLERHPSLRVVTSFVDDELTKEAFMRPGIGDFGDRFYGSNL